MKCPEFEPMPKRFLVWDKGLKKFYEDSNGIVSSGGVGWLAEFLNNCGRPQELLEVVQFTNHFDKDGGEIFEGSIVENCQGWKGVVRQYKGQWAVDYVKVAPVGAWQLLYDITNHIVVVGHVFSNPELLEEEK